ncbi:MAG: hypothetical protein RI562_04535 [Salibacter sp.]|uniref:hypothetical protein n=1 Tax=Salibacter sp. TaxID=2010995 RepID=UPI002870ABC0|nr:hypothetical protein [Salibacter sp.]MDR9398307.1 hypothetical protein [Salibacter sp.]
MKIKILHILCSVLVISLPVSSLFAQGAKEYNGGLKIKLNEEGSKYFRFITWHQVWTRYNENNTGSTRLGEPQRETFDFGLRRSRFLMYAQLNKRMLILTHFGINNQNAISGGYLGLSGKKPQLFMHDAWADFTVAKRHLNIGFGLHFWNGLSRMSNASTLNLMAYDAPIFNWATIEATDQFARHLGVFAKGKFGKLDYRVAVNDPFSTNTSEDIQVERSLYNPSNNNKIYTGYLMYQFLDEESNLLPYTVGSYLGTKKVFNLGAGFHYNNDAMWYATQAGDTTTSDILLFSADVFADIPLNEEKKDALTAYAVYYNFDFGPNNVRNIGILNPANGGGSLRGNAFPVLGTGSTYYGQIGYLLPEFSEKVRIQPYGAYAYSDFEGVIDSNGDNVPVHVIDGGANFYFEGHHSKLTLNYRSRPDFTNPNDIVRRSEVTLQAMIYL